MKAAAIYAPSLAAMHLAGQLPGGQALWLARLANWRRPSRVGQPPIPHAINEAGNPVYDPVDLDAFIAANLDKQALVAEAHGENPVKAVAVAHIDSPTEAPHVRVSFAITGATQSVFAIDGKNARRLADMLLKAADQVERIMPMAEGGFA